MILLLCTSTVTFNIREARAEPRTWIVDDDGPADFHTIQEAINAANSGDIVYVKEGIYYENVVVNKTLSLIGEDRNSTIIDGMKIDTVVFVKSKDVLVSNFTIRNSNKDIESSPSPYYDTCNGIYVTNNNCTIRNNVITDNGIGINLYSSNNHNIIGNIIKNNVLGVHFYRSRNNMLRENSISDNEYFNLFFEMISTADLFSWNIDTSNTVNGKPFYYLLNQTDLTITPSTYPQIGSLMLINSLNITVNDINATEIWLVWTNSSTLEKCKGTIVVIGYNNTVMNCVSTNKYIGMSIGGADESSVNTFVGNTLINCTIGLSCDESVKIYHNNFIDNEYDIFFTQDHRPVIGKPYPSGGNYWSNYQGADLFSGPFQNETGSDGIGDTPYTATFSLSGQEVQLTDSYPLMGPITMFYAGTFNNKPYYIDIISNSTISDFYFNPDEGPFIRFHVSGADGTSGFCRVTIPKDLLWAEEDHWTVLVDGEPVKYRIIPVKNYTIVVDGTPIETITPDPNFTYIYFTYGHSARTIEIRGTHVIPEFPFNNFLPLLMIVFAVLTLLKRKIKT